MKKVDSNNGVWVNDDPATLTNGTPIDADVMNNIQDEISNVITDNGGTLDGTNHSQLSQTLNKNFAKLNSPTLTGVPLTSNPDGTINNQIATVDYVNQKALQATVGFTPVQQSGGTDQGANKVYVGADKSDATQARIQIDQTDLGKIVFQQEDNDTYGVSRLGYNHVSDELAFYDTGNKVWHFSYTTDQIDAKQWISSLPDGNNAKVNDIIWNSSSSLPALYYGTDNSVAYLATEAWSQNTFQPAGNYATQAWSSRQFVGRGASIYDFTPLQIGVNKESGKIWTSYTDDSGNIKYAFSQPAGDYATNPQLQGDMTLSQQYHFRTDGYTTFYRQASDPNAGIIDWYSNYKGNNNNVLRFSSDGSIYTLSGGNINLNNPYATAGNSGDYNASPTITFGMSGRGASATLRFEEAVGRTNQLTLSLPSFNNNGGKGTNFWFDGPSGRINSTAGSFAFTSEVVSPSQYAADFATSDSRVINLAYGHRIQFFTVWIDGNGTNSHRINYPQAFSGNSTVTFNLNDTGQSRSVSLSNNTTPDSTGFNIAVSVHGNSTAGDTGGLTLTVIAMGP